MFNEKMRQNFYENDIKLLSPINSFSISKFWNTIGDFIYLKRTINKYKIDLIHIMFAEPSALWALGKWYLNIPIVLTTRGSDVLLTIPNFKIKKSFFSQFIFNLYKIAFNKVNFITCTSKVQELKIRELLLKDSASNIKVVRTGVRLDDILNDTKQFMLPTLEGKKYILFPRQMAPIYNHEFSIDSIMLLPPEIKEEYYMVFIDINSPNQNYVSIIKEKIDSIKDTNFVFLEEQSQKNLFELYKNASLIVMNPLSDGTPVSALEAMALEIPVILGPLNYDKDIFEDCIWQFKDWEPVYLTELITKILTKLSKVEIEEKTKSAINKVKKLADFSAQIKEVQQIYNNVINVKV